MQLRMHLRTSRATATNSRGLASLSFSCNWGTTTHLLPWVEFLSGQYFLQLRFQEYSFGTLSAPVGYTEGRTATARATPRGSLEPSPAPAATTRERRERLPATEIHAHHFQCIRYHDLPQNRSDAPTQNAHVPAAYSRPPASLHRQIRQNTSTGTLIRNLALENAQKTQPDKARNASGPQEGPGCSVPASRHASHTPPTRAEPKAHGTYRLAPIDPVPVGTESNCGSVPSHACLMAPFGRLSADQAYHSIPGMTCAQA